MFVYDNNFRTFVELPRLLKHLRPVRGGFNMTSLWYSSEITTPLWPIHYTTIKTTFIGYISYTLAMKIILGEVISRFSQARNKEAIFYFDEKWLSYQAPLILASTVFLYYVDHFMLFRESQPT